MSSYTITDFSESLHHPNIAGNIDEDSIVAVTAAWGDDSGGGGEWSGGFLLELNDGRYAYVSGWCDYTGWGCQDGAFIEFFDHAPAASDINDLLEPYQTPLGSFDEWDRDPEDLNLWIKTPSANRKRW